MSHIDEKIPNKTLVEMLTFDNKNQIKYPLADCFVKILNDDNNVPDLKVFYSENAASFNDLIKADVRDIPAASIIESITRVFVTPEEKDAITPNLVQVAAAHTFATNTDTVECTSGTFTVTLPPAASHAGKRRTVKNSGAGIITVDGNAAETIDGALTYSLGTQYSFVTVQSNGVNWIIVGK